MNIRDAFILQITAGKPRGTGNERHSDHKSQSFAFNDARCCDSPSLQQPEVTTDQHIPAPNSTQTLMTAWAQIVTNPICPCDKGHKSLVGEGPWPGKFPGPWSLCQTNPSSWHHGSEGWEDRGGWCGQRAQVQPCCVTTSLTGCFASLPSDPKESNVKDLGMFICTNSLDNMGTPTQVSEEEKTSFLKLLSADINSHLRACPSQPPLPVTIKSTGNTPNATCLLHRENWSP